MNIDISAAKFWLLSGFLLLIFLTGGSSRSDVQSLVILGPISVLVCGVGLVMLPLSQLLERKWLFAGFLVIFITLIFYNFYVPHDIRQQITGVELPQLADRASDQSFTWRHLTASASNTWASMISLVTPLAVVILAIQLTRRDLFRTVFVVALLGALSGFLGVLQAAEGGDSTFYLYNITNNGSAVGLFANRNHAALFLACLGPILAFYAASTGGRAAYQQRRRYFAGAMLITLVPLILVTGSRSGLLVFLIGTIVAALLYRTCGVEQRADKAKGAVPKGAYIVGALFISVGFLTYFFARAASLERLFFETQSTELRQDFWTVSLNLFWQYLPLGSGPGSFANVYRIVEPLHLLNHTYVNRAHNDWIETAVTFGVVGIAGLLIACVLFTIRNWTVWRKMDGRRRSVAISRLGGVILLLIALASVTDYPLRTPAMMSLFGLSCIWLFEAGRTPNPHTFAVKDQDPGYL